MGVEWNREETESAGDTCANNWSPFSLDIFRYWNSEENREKNNKNELEETSLFWMFFCLGEWVGENRGYFGILAEILEIIRRIIVFLEENSRWRGMT